MDSGRLKRVRKAVSAAQGITAPPFQLAKDWLLRDFNPQHHVTVRYTIPGGRCPDTITAFNPLWRTLFSHMNQLTAVVTELCGDDRVVQW